MLFLKFWAISSLICLIILWIKAKTAQAIYIRKYGKPKKKINTTIWEKTEHVLPLFVPLANIAIVIYLIFGGEKTIDKAVEEIRAKILKQEQEN